MPTVLKTIIKYALSIGVAGFLLWLIISTQDPLSLWERIKNADLRWLVASFAVSIFSHFLRAYRWNILMEPLGHTPALKNSFSSVMVAYMVNIIVPRGGEVSRCAMLYKTDKIPVNESFGTVVTERIFDLLTLFICIIIAFLVQFDLLKDFVFSSVQKAFNGVNISAGHIMLSIAGFVILLVTAYLLFKWAQKKFHTSNFFQKLMAFKKGLVNGLLSFRKIRKKWQFVVSTVVIWICYFYMSYVMFFSLEGTSHLGFNAGMAILVLGGLGMALPVPGGTGSFHFFVITGLFALFAIPEEVGTAYAFIVHSSQLFLMLTGGFAALMFILFTSKKKTETKTNIIDGKLAKNSVG